MCTTVLLVIVLNAYKIICKMNKINNKILLQQFEKGH